MPAHRSRCVLFSVLLWCATTVEAGRVRNALFNMFGSKDKDTVKSQSQHEGEGFDADQLELMDWFSATGFKQYAVKEWIEKFDDDISYDSIEDFVDLVEDLDHDVVGIEKDTAMKIQVAARKHVLNHFLSAVPLPPGAPADLYVGLLDKLIAKGYDDADDVADLEEDEAEDFGLKPEELKVLATYGEEWEVRQLFHFVMKTYEYAANGFTSNPFESESAWKPMVDGIAKSGVRNLADLYTVTVTGVDKDLFELIKDDPRVRRHEGKQEL